MFISSDSNMIHSTALSIVYGNEEHIWEVSTVAFWDLTAEQHWHADAQV